MWLRGQHFDASELAEMPQREAGKRGLSEDEQAEQPQLKKMLHTGFPSDGEESVITCQTPAACTPLPEPRRKVRVRACLYGAQRQIGNLGESEQGKSSARQQGPHLRGT